MVRHEVGQWDIEQLRKQISTLRHEDRPIVGWRFSRVGAWKSSPAPCMTPLHSSRRRRPMASGG